jgi:hypothetical protein
VRGKKVKIIIFLYLHLNFSQKYFRRKLKFYTSYLVYSQIWLIVPRDDHHFFYIFLWMVTLATNKNSLKKHPSIGKNLGQLKNKGAWRPN